MGRKKDGFWRYAERLDKRFRCHFCLEVFPGGVVRLKYHLSGISGGGIQACSKVSETTKNAAMLSLNVVSKKRKTKPSSSGSDGGSSKVSNADCSNEVGYLLAKLFEITGINYDIVESSSFTNLVSALIKSGPGCMLPSSSELRSKLIPSFRKDVEDYVNSVKQSWIETGCTLIPIFELNEKEGRSFVNIFGCSRGSTVLLNTSEVPANTNLVGPFLHETVQSIVQIVGSYNIVQCIVDASEYGEYFSSFLRNQFPHVYLTNCAAREINLLFEEICRDIGWIRITFSKINLIVDYMCSDTTILALLRKYTKGKQLKQPLGSDCLSNYKMLESVLDIKEELVQLVQSHEWLASGYNKGQSGSEVTTYIEDPKTWDLGEKVQKALRSLSQVLYLVDFHDSSSGYLLGVMGIVEHSISRLWSSNKDMYQELWDIFKSKMRQIISDFHFMAAFLNPAYMCTEQGKNADMKPVINYILERFIAAGDQEAFVKEVYEYRKMLSDESKPFETKGAKIYLPCQWWECCGEKLTILRNLAIRILSQPFSTSTCKNSMHTVEALLVKQQRELTQVIKHLDSKMNAILMERFNNDKHMKGRKKSLKNSANICQTMASRLIPAIASPIRIGQNVEGEKGCRIHVFLEDPATGRVVQDGIPSTLPLTISVLDGHFSNEEHSTREYFNINELSDKGVYVNGDLEVTLIRGEGTLGSFSFNYSSADTESGKFKLAVKTHTGDYGGFRILEGISNAFIVEDAEDVSTEHPMAHVDPQNGSFSSNPGQNWFSNYDPLIENESNFMLGAWNDTPNYPLQGINHSLAQEAARRVKKKALKWQLQSCGRRRTLKMGFRALRRKRRGEEVLKAKSEVDSTSGGNNVNGQEVGEENVEPMGLEPEEVDSLSCSSTSAVARDSISAKPVGQQ